MGVYQARYQYVVWAVHHYAGAVLFARVGDRKNFQDPTLADCDG
jgi:hypothetical protein